MSECYEGAVNSPFDDHRIKDIWRLIKQNSVLFIVGSPFIGKTRLLAQLQASIKLISPGSSSYWLEANRESLPEAWQQSPPDFVFLDDFESNESLFQKLLEWQKIAPGSKLITTGLSLPELPPSLLHKSYVYSLEKWTPSEIRRLLSESEAVFLDKIYEACEGHPYVARNYLFEKHLADEVDIRKLKKQLLKLSLERFRPKSRKNLFIFLQLSYSAAVSQELLEELSSSERSWLLQQKVLQKRDGLQMTEMGRELLKDLLPEFVEDPQKLMTESLDYLHLRHDYFSRKDRALLNIKIGHQENALQDFIRIASEIYSRAEFSDYIKLSNPLLNKLPTHHFLLRRDCFAYFGQQAKALEEIEERLAVTSVLKDKTALLYAKSLCLFAMGKFEEAVNSIDESLSLEAEDEIYIRSLLAKSFFLTTKDHKEAIDLTYRAEQLIKELPVDPILEAELCFQRALIYDFLHQKSESLLYYREAQRIFSSHRNKSKELLCALNVANLEFDAGNTRAYLSLMSYVESESEKHSLAYLSKLCVLSKSIYLVACGKLKNAEKMIRQTVDDPLTYKHRVDYLLLRRLCIIYIQGGRYGDGRALAGKIQTPDLKARSPQDYLAMKKMSEIADASLLKNFSRFPRILKETLESNLPPAKKIEIVVCLMDLNFKFYMPTNLKEHLPALEQLLQHAYEIDSMVHLKLLCGIYYLLQRNDQKAFRLLSEAHLSAKEASFDLFTYRGSVFLSLYYLSHQKTKLALNRLKEARKVYTPPAGGLDSEVAIFCEAACYISEGENSKLEEILQSLPPSSHLKFRIEEILDRHSSTNQLNVTSFQAKLFEHFQKMLRLGKKQFYKVITSQKIESLSADRLSHISTSAYDIIVNEVSGKIKIGKKQVSINKKSLLIKLLNYLLKSEGRFVSKEELCLRVWHENYNPIVHDQRIYTAVKRLRNLLKNPKIILSREGTYSVPLKYKYIIFSEEDSSPLNDRLSWILRFVETNGSSSRSTIQSALRVSSSSCKMDLRLLVENGKLEAFGRGRNTRYRRPQV